MRSLAVAILVLFSGCDLYFGGDDDPCEDYGWGAADIAPYELRNPQTGICQDFGGGYPCDNKCGPCPAYDLQEPNPDWGSCYSQCEGLAENTCMVTSGCRVAYLNNPFDDGGPQFWGCWATAPSGPIQGGGCAGLDAHTCSRHDDCSALYTGEDWTARTSQVAYPEFTACQAEKTGAPCAGDQDCSADERCTAGVEECNSNPTCTPGGACTDECWGRCVPRSSCANVDCGTGFHCEEQCSPCAAPIDPSCDPTCAPMCVPDTNACLAIDCAPGYECVQVCTDGVGGNPGTCTVTCVLATVCEAEPTEATCSQRTDCTPVYLGEDCTCYPGSCECNVLTYERCETK